MPVAIIYNDTFAKFLLRTLIMVEWRIVHQKKSSDSSFLIWLIEHLKELLIVLIVTMVTELSP